jgi:phosphinothricin acetyltransferase
MKPNAGPVISVRDSRDADIAAISRIYAHWVGHGLASFELDPPDEPEIARRRKSVLASGFPYIVAEDQAGAVAGFAYAGPYRTRPAYRFTCEDSIYVSPHATGAGVGRALLRTLIVRCEVIGLRVMVAIIGDGTPSSIRVHTSLGFKHAGTLPAVGWKHNRWVDTVFMVRPLGPGAESAPHELRYQSE